jgi:omega-amidase
VENQFFVAGCNRAGGGADASEHPFGGYSGVSDPWGRVVAEAGPEPELLFASLDLDEVARARRLFPFFGDRRPDVYATWTPGADPGMRPGERTEAEGRTDVHL